MSQESVYLYGVLNRTSDGLYLSHGVCGAPVYLLAQGDLAAAVSFISESAAPQSASAHEQVMRHLLQHAAVLPAPLGTILSSQGALLEFLDRQQRRLLGQLQRFAGLIEVQLHAVARDANSALAMTAERAYLRARFGTALRSGGYSVKALPLRGEKDLLRLACLLPQDSLEAFIATCESLKSRVEPSCALSISPPMGPVDFIDLPPFVAQVQPVWSEAA